MLVWVIIPWALPLLPEGRAAPWPSPVLSPEPVRSGEWGPGRGPRDPCAQWE